MIIDDSFYRGKAKYWSDMWAIVVILYLLLYGKLPFQGPNDQAIMKSIITKNPEINQTSGRNPISDEAQDLLKKLLRKNHLKRLTADDCKRKQTIFFVLSTVKEKSKA
eukprot:TRINITY_DN191852_c0_g1_i1.p1 TRINITY_DN191852_c0_g1~~TRINITY_DN191852_c0_g1_i1.p1  ORF type:complete len:108 (-),score=16.13 TRINITY_DN191852_c0_g1_i1:379-702(-)